MNLRNRGILFAALTLLALPLPAQITGELESQPSPIYLTVRAETPRPQPISPTIFGTFLEPIRHATYGGLWAGLLENPSLETGMWDAPHVAAMLQERPELAQSSQLDLPLPWEPLYLWQGNRYEPRRGDAANSDQSLMVMALPSGETGIRQKIYLPARGVLSYTGSLWVKHLSGSENVDVSLRERDHPEKVLAHAAIDAAGPEWTRYAFSLELAPGEAKPLVPVDFVISFTADARALIDEISLMPADNVDGMDPKVIAMVRDLDSPVIRFGGNFTSGYHFRDGLGPRDKRVSMQNLAWGIPEYNTFGTDEFLLFCRLVGAQPQIAVNMGSGTPQEAADWVRYVNTHWAARNSGETGGHLWELGNELWGRWTFGFPANAEDAAKRTVAFSEAIRAVDPKAKLIATGGPPAWNAQLLKTKPGTFNYLSIHWVASDENVRAWIRPPDFMALANLAQPVGIEKNLREEAAQIAAANRKNVRIAFTEWLFNSSATCDRPGAGAPDHTTMGGAIQAAGFLNMLMRVSDIVSIADMTGTVECAGVQKRQGRVFATPSYYVMRMYSNEHPDHLIPVENDGPVYSVDNGMWELPEIKDAPWLEVVAAETAGRNKLILFGVNRSLKYDLTAEIKLDGFEAGGPAKVQTLSSPSLSDQNSAEHPEQVIPKESTIEADQTFEYTFPRSSVAIIELDRSGK